MVIRFLRDDADGKTKELFTLNVVLSLEGEGVVS